MGVAGAAATVASAAAGAAAAVVHHPVGKAAEVCIAVCPAMQMGMLHLPAGIGLASVCSRPAEHTQQQPLSHFTCLWPR